MDNMLKRTPISSPAVTGLTVGIYLVSLPVAAYIGPGAGLSAIGSLLALIAAIVVAIFGFLWYPLKRIIRKRKMATEPAGSMEDNQNLEFDSTRSPESQVDELE